ncbi:hypothetical protein LT85_2154 [Collimonas arenae]|uniref:Uncharacterized protein n=1 Tax=Collimonas arenae TaxID=279058 RepID=A0A0A1FEQ9_9BURK|nr:hypothetical protein LT85_2154 [Collimonas arenae]
MFYCCWVGIPQGGISNAAIPAGQNGNQARLACEITQPVL